MELLNNLIIPDLDSNYFSDPILRSKILYSLMKVHKGIYIQEHIYMGRMCNLHSHIWD